MAIARFLGTRTRRKYVVSRHSATTHRDERLRRLPNPQNVLVSRLA